MKSALLFLIAAMFLFHNASAETEQIVMRTIKEARPAPGFYCNTVRRFNSYEEHTVVALNDKIITMGHIAACMRKLPKQFGTRPEKIESFPIQMFQAADLVSIQCSHMKPEGGPPRFMLNFVVFETLTQGLIDDCFEKAKSTPGIVHKNSDI